MAEPIAGVLKRILVSPSLFEVTPRSALATHELGQAIKLLVRHGYVDSAFARSLAEQVVALADVNDYMVQLQFEDEAQQILELLIADHPEEVWDAIKVPLEPHDALLSHRLSGLLGSKRPF